MKFKQIDLVVIKIIECHISQFDLLFCLVFAHQTKIIISRLCQLIAFNEIDSQVLICPRMMSQTSCLNHMHIPMYLRSSSSNLIIFSKTSFYDANNSFDLSNVLCPFATSHLSLNLLANSISCYKGSPLTNITHARHLKCVLYYNFDLCQIGIEAIHNYYNL